MVKDSWKWLKDPIKAKAAAWVAGSLAALIAAVVAFGKAGVDMAVASTPTVQAIQTKVARTETLETALKNFIEASAEVNPALGEALDRRRASQDSIAAAEARAAERLRALGR